MLSILFTCCAVWTISRVINAFRYETSFRRFILRVITPGKVVFINSDEDIDLIKKILVSPKKGNGIERQFAMDAWLPIYNVESVDDELWQTLRQKVLKIIHTIKLDSLRNHTRVITSELMTENEGIVTAKDITILPARIFFKTLFDKELPVDDYDLFYKSSIEWRKEVALKSKGDWATKQLFVDYISECIHSNDIHQISSFAQPFFISPMINVSDIYVSIFKHLDIYQNHSLTKEECKNIVLESIRIAHPFPILERELLKDIDTRYKQGTHVYIELDNFIQDATFDPDRWADLKNPYTFLPFGTGPRQCIGKSLAIIMLTESLHTIVNHQKFDPSIFTPEKGHTYSGRNNDKVSDINETIYIFKKLWKACH